MSSHPESLDLMLAAWNESDPDKVRPLLDKALAAQPVRDVEGGPTRSRHRSGWGRPAPLTSWQERERGRSPAGERPRPRSGAPAQLPVTLTSSTSPRS